jgi:hypothetical protein
MVDREKGRQSEGDQRPECAIRGKVGAFR